MDDFAALQIASDGFRAVLTATPSDHLDVESVLDGWSTRRIVNHVINQSRATSLLLAGGSTADAAGVLAAEYGSTTEDLLLTFDAVMAEQLAALRVPGALDRTVEHPIGSVLVNTMLNYRIVDVLVHTWDLAKSIGVSVKLDEHVALRAWNGLQPLAPTIGQIGAFGSGPSGVIGVDAPIQDRLLDLVGRNVRD